jgi:hypothetical protein
MGVLHNRSCHKRRQTQSRKDSHQDTRLHYSESGVCEVLVDEQDEIQLKGNEGISGDSSREGVDNRKKRRQKYAAIYGSVKMSVPVPERVSSRIREADIMLLYGLAEGLQFKEMAEQCHMTESAVSNRVFWLRHTIFRARTNAQLVALSYHYGILRSPNGIITQTSASGM